MTTEKTEQPTPKRLDDARKKGQVSMSRDVTSTALLIVLFAYFGATWHDFMNDMQYMITLPGDLSFMQFRESLNILTTEVIKLLLKWTFPLMLVIFVTGTLASFFQVGAIFSVEPIKPSMSKINPVEALKKMFSVRNLVEFLKNCIKVVFLGYLLYRVIKSLLPLFILMPISTELGILKVLYEAVYRIAINTAIAYLIVAAADFFFQKKQHMKQLMMTKDEVKREYKEMEGDPEIKGHRKQRHRELAMGDMVQKAKKSSVVITNPVHRAVAIRYEKEETLLPVVVAKGKGVLARRIVEVARASGIPVVQNIPLARALYDNTPIDDYVPTELLEAVAEILRWVQDLKQQAKG